MSKAVARRGWNPKRLGVVKPENGPHETDVWLYLTGRKLEIVIQVSEVGIVKGTAIYTVTLPALREP
mgnify:FL=1